MLFNSFKFMLFFPLATVGYYLTPKKYNFLWLLAVSTFFYLCWSPRYLILIGISILATYLAGRILESIPHEKRAARRWALGGCLGVNLAILFFFKYYNFVAGSVNALGGRLPALDVLLPIGISFYTFQALGYAIDVFRGDIPAEKNLLRYATFILFFPQLVAGPIERAGNLLPQFYERHTFDYENVRAGLLRMGWGFFVKMVIADRLAMYVDGVYAGLDNAWGFAVLLVIPMFTLQIYCDFSSYSNIAIGAAQVLGFRLSKNFDAPLLASSVGDFWRRWHITLSTWLRDYVYIPLGGNRKGTARKCVNLMLTFLVSGLWHGAAWTFVLWGALHGAAQAAQTVWHKIRGGVPASAPQAGKAKKFLCWLGTFLFISCAFVVFRADNLAQAGQVFAHAATGFSAAQLWDGSLLCFGMDGPDMLAAAVAVAVLAAVDVLGRRQSIAARVEHAALGVRWAVYLALFFAIYIFGIYGVGVAEKPFIYFQF
ncbi:MAG: MBOAT family protein [Faecalibacterium sp.]|nr:MBOAT family protein [Faecalibacterium sp.]